jgi:two-component system, chemotaxis family, sensor kinase Cph1
LTESGTEYNPHSTIQPYGLLFVVDANNFLVEQVSANVESMLGLKIKSILGKSIFSLLEKDCAAITESYLRCDDSLQLQPLGIKFSSHGIAKPFAIRLDRQNSLIVIEAEPLDEQEPIVFADASRYLFGVMDKLTERISSAQVMQMIVSEIRGITKFDRVVISRFDEDNNGVVIAENKAPGLVSYVGYHYSASDLPASLFQAYMKNPLRYIRDTNYTPCPLVSAHPDSQRQPDLSTANLRVLPPPYLDHLRVMKVASSLHFAIVCNGKLWGLAVCQHPTVKQVSFRTRAVCETLVNGLAMRLSAQLDTENLESQLKTKTFLDNISRALEESQSIEDALLETKDSLLDLFNCEGTMVVTEKGAQCMGALPNNDTLQKALDYLNTQQIEEYFSTDCLNDCIDIKEESLVSAGLLAIKIPATENEWILCFRKEKPIRITWVGSPPPTAKPVGSTWLETIRDRSGAWQECDFDNARKLRSLMAEIRLKRLVAQVSEANKLHAQREEFISCLAHDLKGPVVGAVRILQTLKDDRLGELKNEHKEIVESLINGHGVLLERINALLLAYKYESIGIKLNLTALDASEFVRRCIDKLKDSASAHEIDLSFCQSDKPAMIMAEEESLQRVIDNLVGNAIKFSKPGSPVLVSVQADDADVHFRISDTAGGIDAQDQPHIFRRFWQGIPGKRYAAGTGLGLYICQKIVRLHGGTISFTSDTGKGTTFEVSLPKYVALSKRPSKEMSLQ